MLWYLTHNQITAVWWVSRQGHDALAYPYANRANNNRVLSDLPGLISNKVHIHKTYTNNTLPLPPHGLPPSVGSKDKANISLAGVGCEFYHGQRAQQAMA